MSVRRTFPSWAIGTLGLVAMVAVWWLLAVTVFAPDGGDYTPVPTPWAVLQAIGDAGLDFYWTNFSVTLREAATGYVWGNGLALALSALVLVVPQLEGILMQVAVVTYCVPIVALGSIAIIVLGGAEAPGEPSPTAVFLAALSVIFTTVVGTVLGLKAADASALDVVTVYGGSRLTQLRKVRLVAALPQVLSALQIAVPAAFLGAILGEYFGKIETGVGPALVAAQGQLQAAQVWAIFLLCALVAIVGYGAVGLVGRLVAPWSSGTGGRA